MSPPGGGVEPDRQTGGRPCLDLPPRPCRQPLGLEPRSHSCHGDRNRGASPVAVMRSTFVVACDSGLPTWKWFVAVAVGVAPLMLPAGRAGRLGPRPRPKLQEKAQGDS